MECKVFLTGRADKQLEKIPPEKQKQCISALSDLEKGDQVNVVKLHSPLSGYRLRVGEYRILFTNEHGVCKVYAIVHRRDAYR